jgi:hypothetical protein
MSSHPNFGIHILWEFGTGNGDGAGLWIDVDHIGTDGVEDKVFSFQFLSYPEKIGGVMLFELGHTVRECQLEGKELDLWFLILIGESQAWAFGVDAAFGTEGIIREMIEAVEDSVSDLSEGIVYRDGMALVAEVSAAFVPGPGVEESAVVGEDFVGNHAELFEDADQDMKDLLVEILAKARSEIGEGCLAGEILHGEAGISSVGPSLVFVADQGENLGAVQVALKESKQIDQEETWRIVAGRAHMGVAVGDEASNEGEIDQRSDHLWVTTLDGTVGEDFDKPLFELVV